MKILVTGAAGFIGHHLCLRLSALGHDTVGLDSLNDYYDVRLKQARLAGLEKLHGFRFVRMDLADRGGLESLFSSESFDAVINLAAQAGVRYSLENPHSYIDSNISGFVNLIECCRRHPVTHFLYASSSSVYGGNTKVPFSEDDWTDNPVSLYAATKKSDELIAGVYSRLYGIPVTAMRFFTVYGPWGRPDMAPMLFTKAILSGTPIKVFNHGDMQRDFTYIDDVAEGVTRLIALPPEGGVLHDIYNIGSGHPMPLMDFIRTLEEALGRKAEIEFLPMQPGDVSLTYADTAKLQRKTGYIPETSLKDGIAKFTEWYLSKKNPLF